MHSRSRTLLMLASSVLAVAGGVAAGGLAAAAAANPGPERPSSTTGTVASSATSPATTTPTTTTTTSTTTPSDAESDRSALTDYRNYLKALVKGASGGVAQDAAFTATVKKRCSGALAPLTALPSSQVSATALSDLGEEIGGDLAIDYLSEADTPFAKLSPALEVLVWSDPAPEQAIGALLSAESAVLSLTSSSLCADARSLAAHPARVPRRTVAFLGPYLTYSATLRSQLSEFLAVLSRYATTDDNSVISQINALVAKFAASSAMTEHSDATAILAALGLTS